MEVTEESPIRFACNCSKERVSKALISIGKKELQEMIEDGEDIEVNCHFCGKSYSFTPKELRALKEMAVRE